MTGDISNLFFICGPHGAGKTTLLEQMQKLNPKIMLPKLVTRTVPLHTDPYERIKLKLCQRALENYETIIIAKQHHENIIIGNRCVYDAIAYADSYLKKSWISKAQHTELLTHNTYLFPTQTHEPKAIILNPPVEQILSHLQSRWRTGVKKWNEEDVSYASAAHEAYKQFKNNRKILYFTKADPSEVMDHMIRMMTKKPY